MQWFEGWINPMQVTGTQNVSINAASSAANTGVAVQLLDNPGGPGDWTWNGAGSGEYFLVENRQRTPGSYDESLPGSGLLVLHVHESRGNNSTDTDRLVDVEEADGLTELDVYGGAQGDGGDVYPGTSNNTAFDAATNPNSNLVNGSASGASMSGVSSSAASMSATFTGPGGGPPPNDDFVNATSITSRTFSAAADNSQATVELAGGEASQSCNGIGRTLWYRYQPSRDVRIVADTQTSSLDTVLNVWRGTSLNGLAAVACNDDVDSATNQFWSRTPEFVAQAGQTYYFQAGGFYDPQAQTVAAGTLVFHLHVRPVNDDFADAQVISGPTGSVTGNNVNGGKQTNEPNHANNVGGASIWYRWTAPSNGDVTFDTTGTVFDDTLLAVYTGSSVAGPLVAQNDDINASSNHKSRLTFPAVQGTTYSIAVDGYGAGTSNRGELTLGWQLGVSPDPTNLTVTGQLRAPAKSTAFEYHFVVTRSGASNAADVDVELSLPTSVRVDSLQTSQGTCSSAATVICHLAAVSPGSTVSIDATVTPRSPGPHAATASLADPLGTTAADDSSTLTATPDFVCDNHPTAGPDNVQGTRFADVLCGLAGADVLTGNGGDDLMFGGPGTDTVSYRKSSAAMIVNLNFQSLEAEGAWPRKKGTSASGRDHFTGVERVVGSAYGDKILGRTTAPDTLSGLGGADLIYGYGGKDTLFGGSGADKLYGGNGRDRVNGGGGRDLCRDPADALSLCEI